MKLLNNRSLAATKLEDWLMAAKDALGSLAERPDESVISKMWYRLGCAAVGLGLITQARVAFQLGLHSQPR
jgi:hypothetical protein